MEIRSALDFLGHNHRAVIGTFRADGMPSLSPVLTAVDTAGRVVVSTRETAYKVRHVRRDPRVVVCALTDQFFGEWLQLEGIASVVSLPTAMDGLVDYYRRVSGEHPDWDDYRASMVREQRCLLRIEVSRAGPDRRG